jgi:hypothetical protein
VVQQPTLLAIESIFVPEEERQSGGVTGVSGEGRLTARIFHISVNKYLHSPNDRLCGPSTQSREAMRMGYAPLRRAFSSELPSSFICYQYSHATLASSVYQHSRFSEIIFVSRFCLFLRRKLGNRTCHDT